MIHCVSDAMECNAARRAAPSVTAGMTALKLMAGTKCLTTSGGSGSDASLCFPQV